MALILSLLSAICRLLQQVQSKCGSRTDSGSSCCPAIHSRMLKGHSPQNAARERNRVRSLREAFYNLQVKEDLLLMWFNFKNFSYFETLIMNQKKKKTISQTACWLCAGPQAALPSVPPDTKLSKLDVLVLATNYIAYLTKTLDDGGILTENSLPPRSGGYLHPVKVSNKVTLFHCI